MRMPLSITFGKSTSPLYDRAVQLAQGMAGYRRTGEGRDLIHAVTVTVSLAHETTWEKVHQLLRLVSAWRSTSLHVAGQPVRYWALAGRLAQVKDCYARKLRHSAGAGYCSGQSTPGAEATSFGCRFCKGVSREVDRSDYRGASWIQFGRLSPQRDSFRVDKAAILRTLEQETRADGCLFCPAFRWQRVRAAVHDLPDVIDLGGDSSFEVKYSAINPRKALGIQPKEAADNGGLLFGLEAGERPAALARTRNVPNVSYADVAGQDVALEQIKNVVELPLRHPAYFEALRVEPQRGVLLYGPPGNGKTLLAKAVATESNAHFELISGPEILSRWLGQSEENLRRVFERARQRAPSVVLIDELDSIAPRRERLSQQHDVQLLAQLLVLLDGLETRGQVAVIATTNRLEAVDPAVCRPGRFDYHIEVPCPDRAGRAAILRVFLAKMKTRRGLPSEVLADATAGFSGAELAALCREAGLHAIQRGLAHGTPAGKLVITGSDLRHALVALRNKRVPDGTQPCCRQPSQADTQERASEKVRIPRRIALIPARPAR
jgi:AAA+ superfamily predicted ATPase